MKDPGSGLEVELRNKFEAFQNYVESLFPKPFSRLLPVFLPLGLLASAAGLFFLVRRPGLLPRRGAAAAAAAGCDFVERLPSDVVDGIFSRLPVAQVARLSTVSRRWRAALSRPELWRLLYASFYDGSSADLRLEAVLGASSEGWASLWRLREGVYASSLSAEQRVTLSSSQRAAVLSAQAEAGSDALEALQADVGGGDAATGRFLLAAVAAMDARSGSARASGAPVAGARRCLALADAAAACGYALPKVRALFDLGVAMLDEPTNFARNENGKGEGEGEGEGSEGPEETRQRRKERFAAYLQFLDTYGGAMTDADRRELIGHGNTALARLLGGQSRHDDGADNDHGDDDPAGASTDGSASTAARAAQWCALLADWADSEEAALFHLRECVVHYRRRRALMARPASPGGGARSPVVEEAGTLLLLGERLFDLLALETEASARRAVVVEAEEVLSALCATPEGGDSANARFLLGMAHLEHARLEGEGGAAAREALEAAKGQFRELNALGAPEAERGMAACHAWKGEPAECEKWLRRAAKSGAVEEADLEDEVFAKVAGEDWFAEIREEIRQKSD